jgi:putative Holliday junction resolvase
MMVENSTGRWLALDVGSKTLGIAVTDPFKITARPLLTIRRSDPETDCRAVLKLVSEYDVERIIVGRPTHMDGSPAGIMGTIQPFAEKLEKLSGVAVRWQDERLSTRRADELMSQAKLPIPERRKRRNEFAAAVILEWYLDEGRACDDQ